MFKNLWQKLLPRDDENESLGPTDEQVEGYFSLHLDRLEVGRLWYTDGLWRFVYADAFKSQSEVKPLVSFPNVHRVYESERLWPFFAVRIPSLAQPAVQLALKTESLKANDVDLLKRFGRQTATNPFCLEHAV